MRTDASAKGNHVHGLDPATDFSFLVGSTFVQLRIGHNEAGIALDLDDVHGVRSSAYINVESTIRVTHSERTSTFDFMPDAAHALAALVGRQVTAYQILDAGTLRIQFDNGFGIEALDTSEHGESYQVMFGERWWA